MRIRCTLNDHQGILFIVKQCSVQVDTIVDLYIYIYYIYIYSIDNIDQL